MSASSLTEDPDTERGQAGEGKAVGIAGLVALGIGRAADDADTLTVEGVRFRLDGIDAPELDQACLDSAGDVYFCGRKAYEELQKFVANRTLRCDDKGADNRRHNRRIGQCSVDKVDLQRWLVTNGWAIAFEPYAKGRFKDEEVDARGLRVGLWDGCFVAPQDFRYWRKSSATLLGMACPADARDKLFPDDPRMPQGCPIKAKLAYRGLALTYWHLSHRGLRQLSEDKAPPSLVLFGRRGTGGWLPEVTHLLVVIRTTPRSPSHRSKQRRAQEEITRCAH